MRSLPFTLQEAEVVLLFCRRHWVFGYPALILKSLLATAGPLIAVLAVRAAVGLEGTVGLVTWAASFAWFVYWVGRAYFGFYRYRHDVWVVTNQRLVDSLRRHWFHHRLASADLVDVEDIAVVREGVLATALNFGDVRCQTAGEVPNFILAGIPRPTQVLGVVDAARDAARRPEGFGGRLP